MVHSENTAEKMTRVPDKVWLVWFAISTAAIGIVISYMVILNTQAMLQQNDLDIQEKVDELSSMQFQQALDLNTLTVKMDALTDKISGT